MLHGSLKLLRLRLKEYTFASGRLKPRATWPSRSFRDSPRQVLTKLRMTDHKSGLKIAHVSCLQAHDALHQALAHAGPDATRQGQEARERERVESEDKVLNHAGHAAIRHPKGVADMLIVASYSRPVCQGFSV